jgi:hypothetical protein
MAKEKSILYFDEVGEKNTDETLKATKKRAEELGIKNIVVASTRGGTGVKVVEAFKGYNVVVVTHSTGLREPGKQELLEENRKKIEAGGGKILTTGHAFGGVSRAVRKKFDTVGPVDIVAPDPQDVRPGDEGRRRVRRHGGRLRANTYGPGCHLHSWLWQGGGHGRHHETCPPPRPVRHIHQGNHRKTEHSLGIRTSNFFLLIRW